MKSLFYLAIVMIISLQINLSAQSEDSAEFQITEFKVYGNCGMCKARIEKSLTIDGVESADWNKETKVVKVIFDSEKVSTEKLHELVAGVGHDTDKVKAKDETYNKLHGCCKYDRSTDSSDLSGEETKHHKDDNSKSQ